MTSSVKKKFKKFSIRFVIISLILFLVFSYVLLFVQAADQEHLRIETFTSSGSLVVPSGVTSITFEAWGGGGGGSRNSGAGGGAAYMKKIQTVSAGQIYAITVGAKGTGGNPLGTDGASSTVMFGLSTILLAPPGLAGGSVGLGKRGLSTNGTGDSGFNGADGTQGTGTQVGGGGAGNTASASGRYGGDYFGGLAPANASLNNKWYGAGGGSQTSANRNGTDGVVMATYTLDIGSGYPVIKTRGLGHSTGNGTSHPISMPSGIQVGDLLLVMFSTNGAPSISGYTGWTLLDSDSYNTNVSGFVLYKIAEGSDTLTITTSVAESSTHTSFRIANAGIPVSASANGFSANADPPSLDSGVSGKYLWISSVSRDGSSSGRVSAPPTNYTDFITLFHPLLQSGLSDVSTATRHLEAQTEDPGTFTSDNQEWTAFTIAVPFAGGDGGGPGDSIDTVKTLIKGGTTIKGGVNFQFFFPFFQSFLPFLPKFSFLNLYQESLSLSTNF